MAEAAVATSPVLDIERWHSEPLLRALLRISAIGIWIMLAVSLIGIIYAVLLGLIFFFAHLAFIAHLRGNAVRLGPNQMPELFHRVETLARRVGLRETPEAYVVQVDGSLNALATKFLRSHFIVLFSDLLDECGENTDARDFIIAHELGHIHAGHLWLQWLWLPGALVPFLGTAYSRACEYTCDRYGYAASDNKEQALDGLCILAAGGKHGPLVNREALVAQRADLNTVLMTIGHWLSTHPPISHRLVALQPALGGDQVLSQGPAVGALVALSMFVIVPTAGAIVFAFTLWPQIEAASQAGLPQAEETMFDDQALRSQAETGILALADAAESHRANAGAPPQDLDELYSAWAALNPGQAEPIDPYDGDRFGYLLEDGEYLIWSAGPDPDDASDDLYYDSETAAGQ